MTPQTLRAALWMMGAIVSFTAMAVGGRAVSHSLDTFEIMLYRSVTGVIVMVTIIVVLRRRSQIRTDHLGHHVIRNLCHFTGQNLWFLAITLVPLAQVFALEFTSPIWVLLLAPLILGEKVRPIQLVVALLGFGGVLLVADPFGGSVSPGLIWAGIAAIAFALTNLLTRRLTRHESVVAILFWLTVLQLVFGLITAGFDGDIAVPTVTTLPWVVMIGFAGLCAHWCLTNALSLAPASTIMPIDFARLPLIAGIGAVFYAEPLDPMVLLGGTIVFLAAWANLRIAR